MSISRRDVLLKSSLGVVGAAGLLSLSAARGDPNSVVASAAAPTTPTVAAVAGIVGDGVTDDGPAIQAAYDAGGPSLDLSAGKSYLINTPVFFDKPSTYAMFVINLNGAKLLLGPKLPTTGAFWRDPTTRWAFFPNTRRSAWSKTSNTVNVTTTTRASGPTVGALLSLTIRNGTIDGKTANAGLVFANRTGTRFDQVVLYRGRALLSWFDYCDINIFEGCHNRAGGPVAAVLIDQVASGDGLTMNSCKSDASVGVARLKFCRGAQISGIVTGRIELDSCSAIRIYSAHQETAIVNATILVIRNSSVTIDTCVFYLTRGPAGAPPAAITIDDTNSEGHSELMIINSQEMRYHANADTEMGAFLSVVGPTEDTTVTVNSLTSVTATPANGGTWLATVGPKMTIEGPAQAIVDAGLATIAGGQCIIGKQNGQLKVTNLLPPAAAGTPFAPVIYDVTGTESELTGGKLPRSKLKYVLVARDTTGRSGPRVETSATPESSTSTVRIIAEVDSAPCELLIWRYVGTSSTPTAYVSVPCSRNKVTIYDSGTTISGYRWQTTGITAPRT